jgi:hypothetical protein
MSVAERSKARYCGFVYCRGHGCQSVVSVVSCQMEDSGTDKSLVQSSPAVCGVSFCVI